jgi:hypothetical protein
MNKAQDAEQANIARYVAEASVNGIIYQYFKYLKY